MFIVVFILKAVAIVCWCIRLNILLINVVIVIMFVIFVREWEFFCDFDLDIIMILDIIKNSDVFLSKFN